MPVSVPPRSPRATRRPVDAVAVAIAVVIGMMTLQTSSARAQGFDAEVRIDQLQLPTPGSRFTRSEGPVEGFDEGIAYAFRLGTDYMYRPLRSRIRDETGEEGEARDLVEHALLLHLGMAIRPVDWLTVEAAIPFSVFADGSDDRRIPSQPFRAGKPGVGDVRAGVHVLAYDTEVLDVSLGARFWAASGNQAAYLAGDDRFVRMELVPAVAGEIEYFLYGCTLGLAPLFFAGRDGDRVAASCGAHFKVAPTVALGLEPHVAVFSFSRGRNNSENTPGLASADLAVQFETLGSLRVDVAGVSFGLAGGPGLGGAPGTPDVRALLTLGFADRGQREVVVEERDADLDGIEDDRDACPDVAGPRDRNGCPSRPDEDGDGIVDDDDACPAEAGPPADDPRANGCPDRDNDHLADPVDACPDEPGAPADDGCPQKARLEAGAFVFDPPVQFPPGQARLPDAARQALAEMSRTLRSSPQVARIQVRVGTALSTRRLTEARVAYLVGLFDDLDVDGRRYVVERRGDLRAGRVEVRVVE
ncbi:MAG: hypothetical protein AAGN82_24410 [Myxococcota bacterium]